MRLSIIEWDHELSVAKTGGFSWLAKALPWQSAGRAILLESPSALLFNKTFSFPSCHGMRGLLPSGLPSKYVLSNKKLGGKR